MPEGVGYSGSNSPVSTGLGITYIGKYVYGYSGQIIINDTNADLFNFSTGAEPLLIKLEWGMDGVDGNDTTIEVELDGVNVLYKKVGTAGSDNRDDLVLGTTIVDMILPPYTGFKLNITSTGSANKECTAWITGKAL